MQDLLRGLLSALTHVRPEAVRGAKTARMVEMLSLGSDSAAAEPDLTAEQLLKNLPREVLDRLVSLHGGDKSGREN